jgi:hypothetical protein
MMQTLPRPPELFDRETEWAEISAFAAPTSSSDRPRIALVYGRRRQGKSFLIDALARATGGFYHQATEEERVPALASFGRAAAAYAGAPGWTAPGFGDWEAAFRAVAEQAAGRPIVIDDFPYLTRKSPELPSLLQAAFDGAKSGRHPSFCLILCGSALSVMTELLVGQQALRGRATIDMLIGPFDFRVQRQFWGIADHDTAMLVSAVLGGPPGYRDLLGGQAPASRADFDAWLFAGALNPSHALFSEADYLLAEDPALVDRSLYQTIVAAVATGTSTRSGLAQTLGRLSTALEHPISQLERARMVLRDEDLLRSGRPLLRVSDPILRFNYAVVRPDRARFEARQTAAAWRDAEQRFRSQVVGPHFEALAREWTRGYASPATVGGQAKRVGFVKVDSALEGRGYELDVVVEGAGPQAGGRVPILALGEAKAGDRPRTVADLARLERLRGELSKRADAVGAKLLLFGRSGFDADLRRAAAGRADVELVDLARLYEGD